MESSSSRLLALLSLLQSRPRWSAPELAEHLHVTTRTVRRDVTRLRELGYPVDGEQGPTGGYRLAAGGALPPLLLTDDEAVIVALGLRAAAGGGIAGFEDIAVAALAKLEQVLPARLRARVGALNATTVRLRVAEQALVDPDVLLVLAQGCRGLERLTFRYRDRAGAETDRRVEPFRLVNADQRWYLVARDVDRDGWRTFRVDRLSDPALTGHRFVRTDEPDAAAMVAEGMALATYRWRGEVLLHADVERAGRSIPPTVGTLEPVAGGTLLRIGADDLDWIARQLAGLPFDFEVLAPRQLRTAVRAVARRLRAAASQRR